MNIIDRRKNPKSKSLVNRRRYMDRVAASIKASAKKAIGTRSITDKGGTNVSVTPDETTKEHRFVHDPQTGIQDYVVTPNWKNYIVGDKIFKPRSNQQSRVPAEGEDDFEFSISYEEYLNVIFDGLELPNLEDKKSPKALESELVRAGYSTDGVPANLNLIRTMRNSISRRIALVNPKREEIRLLEEELETCEDEERKAEILELIAELRGKINATAFIDDFDIRYNNHDLIDKPVNQAVMFCVDGNTEYLSENGWIKIRDYKEGKVAQYSENGQMQFVVPSRYVKNDYEGEFIQIKAQGIDQLLTPEHRVVYRSQTGKLKEILAKDLKTRHNSTAFGFRGKFITHFTYDGEGLPLSDDEIRLHVAFKADGTYQQENTNRAQFIFSKERKVNRLVELLERMNIPYNRTTISHDRIAIYFTTEERIAKRYTSEWYKASAVQLAIISEEVLYWDGYSVRETFCSEFKEDADYIQFVWAANGYGTNEYFSSNVWVTTRCSYSERSLASKVPDKIKTTHLEEKHSYCFAVPSGMLILRRNDNIFVSGNCLMDVSFSMTETHKTMAKKFFLLLNRFLHRQYKHVEVVFVRHHSLAKECNETDFFTSRDSGGTTVSTAYVVTDDIIRKRYSKSSHNIYVAQISDGDNDPNDREMSENLLGKILDQVQFMMYLEVCPDEEAYNFWGMAGGGDTELTEMFLPIAAARPDKLMIDRITEESQIVPTFRKMFAKRG